MASINPQIISNTAIASTSNSAAGALALLAEHTTRNGRLDTQQVAENLANVASDDPKKAMETFDYIKAELRESGNPVDLNHLEKDIDSLLKNKSATMTQNLLNSNAINGEFFVPPPYQIATHPGDGVAIPTYVNQDSLQSYTSEWEGLSTFENSVWGAFKALAVMRGGELLKIGKALSGAGGTAISGATTENLFVQTRTTIYTAEVSDWHGQVYYGPLGSLGNVKAIDFQSLSNTRTVTLEITREYRIMADDKVIYESSPETVTPSKVQDYIPNENGFPVHDVHPKY